MSSQDSSASPGTALRLKSIVGGRIGAYTEMCEQARQQAFDLIVDHARALGANATSSVAVERQ